MASLEGVYNLVPPPGAMTVGEDAAGEDAAGWRPKFRRPRLNIKGALRKAGRGLKGAGRLAVKIHTTPFKYAAKYGKKALKALAMTAAKPIRNMFRKLGMRRARYLSWKNRRSLHPNAVEKAQASTWTVSKMSRNPAGKFGVFILKHTHGHAVQGISGASIMGAITEATAETGITGAEIAAAAAAVIGAIAGLMQALNKPGEAPANPQTAEQQQPSTAPQDAPQAAPQEPPAHTPTEAPQESAGDVAEAAAGFAFTRLVNDMAARKKGRRYVTLHEAKHAAKMWRSRRNMRGFGAPVTTAQAEAHVLRKLHANHVVVVPDNHALPKGERAIRRFAGIARISGEMLGAEKGKKAYRRSGGGGGDSLPPGYEPTADDILRAAERYGGYASKKEAAKARHRANASGDLAVMGGGCSGACEITGCCHSAGEDAAGVEDPLWQWIRRWNRGGSALSSSRSRR